MKPKENMNNSHLSTALQRIRRSPYQAMAAVSIMTMTLFLASVFSLIAAGSQAILQYFETRPQVDAYFKSDYVPPQTEIDRISAQLLSTDEVAAVKFISKEEALNIYKQSNQSDPLLLEAVNANMLPASLEISAKDPKQLKAIAENLKKEVNIDDVRFAEDIVQNLTKWTGSVRIVGAALVGTHVVITFVVILLIISIKVGSRREEIRTLQLIGATNGYISSPFVWEGIVYGCIGAIFAWGITYILLLYSMPFLVTFLAGIPILPPPIWFMGSLLGAEIVLGMMVGGLGGALAVRRFFKS